MRKSVRDTLSETKPAKAKRLKCTEATSAEKNPFLLSITWSSYNKKVNLTIYKQPGEQIISHATESSMDRRLEHSSFLAYTAYYFLCIK